MIEESLGEQKFLKLREVSSELQVAHHFLTEAISLSKQNGVEHTDDIIKIRRTLYSLIRRHRDEAGKAFWEGKTPISVSTKLRDEAKKSA